MEKRILIAFSCFTLALLIPESYGLRCYDCVGCPDPFDKTGKNIVDCESGSCKKHEAKAAGIVGVTTRECSPAKMEDKCETNEIMGTGGTICGCNTDLCNSATTSTISVTAILSVVAGIFMYRNVL